MNEPDFFHVSRRFVGLVGTQHYQTLGLSLAAASAEAIGVGLALPLLESLDASTREQLVWLCAISSLVFAKAALSYFAMARLGELRAQLGATLQERLHMALLQAPFATYLRDGAARWQFAFEQVPYAVGAYQSFCSMQVGLIHALMYLTVACWLSPAFGLAALILAAVVFVGFRWLHRRTHAQAEALMKAQTRLTALALEWLRGMRYLRATGSADVMSEERRDVVQQVAVGESRLAQLLAVGHALREPVVLLGLMVLVAIFLTAGKTTLATVLVALLLFYRAANALLGVQQSWHGVLAQEPALAAIESQFARPVLTRNAASVPSHFEVHLKGVSFAHPGATPLVNEANWRLLAGRWIGLCGDSGVGKSTLFDIVLGLQRPQQGSVLVGGMELDQIDLDAWRAHVGFVPQEAWIKSDTLERNIALRQIGNGAEHASRLASVCRRADLVGTIAALPAGIATKVGEGGIELSGGERQRVALARELYRQPRLLILDEATSALDAESEARLLAALRAEQGDMCVVHASHRQKPLQMADEVWRLVDGRLIRETN